MIQIAVRFRACREEDLPALEWMGLHTREREIIAAAFAAQQRNEAVMLLAEANGYPVGQVWIDLIERGTGARPHFWAIRVFPALQRAGLGARLMAEAERRAAKLGAREAELGVEWDNRAARRFYERLGYRPIGEEPGAVRQNSEGIVIAATGDQQILRKRLRRNADDVIGRC